MAALTILLLLSLIYPPSLVAADVTVQDIRLAPTAKGARVEIEVSEPVAHSREILENPHRFVVDLPESAWERIPSSIGLSQVGLIDSYHFGSPSPGVSRIVFTIDGPFAVGEVREVPAGGQYGFRILTELVRGTADELNGAHLPSPDERLEAGQPSASSSGIPLPALKPRRIAALAPVRERPLSELGEPAPLPETSGPLTIVIDPGHGGRDPGATHGDIYERTIVLLVAKEARRLLEARGFRVVLTRNTNAETVRLRDRLKIAREARGDLMVSLHVDSLKEAPQVRGATVYTLSERASSEEAEALSRKENRGEALRDVDLSSEPDIVSQILIDLAQRDAKNKSILFANDLVESLQEITTLARGSRQQAGFAVLKSPDMPAALVELGYLSNAFDRELLVDPAYQAKLSRAIAKAVSDFFDTSERTIAFDTGAP